MDITPLPPNVAAQGSFKNLGNRSAKSLQQMTQYTASPSGASSSLPSTPSFTAKTEPLSLDKRIRELERNQGSGEELLAALPSHVTELVVKDRMPLFNRMAWRLFALPFPEVHRKLADLLNPMFNHRRVNDRVESRPESIWDEVPQGVDIGGPEPLTIDDKVDRFFAYARSLQDSQNIRVRSQCLTLFIELRQAYEEGLLNRSIAELVWKIGVALALKEAQKTCLVRLGGGKPSTVRSYAINEFLLNLRIPALIGKDELWGLNNSEFAVVKSWIETGEPSRFLLVSLTSLQNIIQVMNERFLVKEFFHSFDQTLARLLSLDRTAMQQAMEKELSLMQDGDHNSLRGIAGFQFNGNQLVLEREQMVNGLVLKLMSLAMDDEHEELPLLRIACFTYLQREIPGLRVKTLPNLNYEVVLDGGQMVSDHLRKPLSKLLARTERLTYVRSAAPAPHRVRPAAPRSSWSLVNCIKACWCCCRIAADGAAIVAAQPGPSNRGTHRDSSSLRISEMQFDASPVVHLDLSQFHELTDQEFNKFTLSYPNIQELWLTPSTRLTKQAIGYFDRTLNIQTFRFLLSSRGSVSPLQEFAALGVRQIEVQLNESDLHRQEVRELLQAIQPQTQLAIQVDANPSLYSIDGEEPLRILAESSPNLNRLDWRAETPSQAALDYLGEHCQELRSISWQQPPQVSGALPVGPKLSTLRIDQADMPPAQLTNLLTRSLTSLESLDLRGSQPFNADQLQLLQKARQLKHLCLVGAPARSLPHLTFLQPIKLEGWQGPSTGGDEISPLLLRQRPIDEQIVRQYRRALIRLMSLLQLDPLKLEKLVSPFLKVYFGFEPFFTIIPFGSSESISLDALHRLAKAIHPWLDEGGWPHLQGMLRLISEPLLTAVQKEFSTLRPDILSPRILLLIPALMQSKRLQSQCIEPLKRGLACYVKERCPTLTMQGLTSFAESETPELLKVISGHLITSPVQEAWKASKSALQAVVQIPGEERSCVVARLAALLLLPDWTHIQSTLFAQKRPKERVAKDEEKKRESGADTRRVSGAHRGSRQRKESENELIGNTLHIRKLTPRNLDS